MLLAVDLVGRRLGGACGDGWRCMTSGVVAPVVMGCCLLCFCVKIGSLPMSVCSEPPKAWGLLPRRTSSGTTSSALVRVGTVPTKCVGSFALVPRLVVPVDGEAH